MSILIKGISSLKEGLYQVQDGKIHAYKGNGGKVQEFDLVEVPTPHGRLIDADALNTDDMIESWVNGDLYRHEWSIDEWINTAPTIIEAEEGEE